TAGGDTTPPPVQPGPKVDPKVDQKVDPKADPKIDPKTNPNPPKVDPGREVLVYKFDPAEVAPFNVRLKGSSVVEGNRGTLPRGVAIYALKSDTEAEYEVGKVGGVSAFTITRHSATTGAQLAF